MIRPTLDPTLARRTLRGVSEGDGLDDAAVVEHYARAVWSVLTEPGDGTAGALIGALGAVGALRLALDEDLLSTSVEGLDSDELQQGLDRWRTRLDVDAVAHTLRIAAEAGVRLLVPGASDWPERLSDLGRFMPLCLWVRGDTRHLSASSTVAIVGARAATSYGEHVALELAADLAGAGTSVVSGAAYGIDGAAHRAALSVGGTTVALLAGGVDRPYPVGHAEMLGRIARTGAVVSEVPCGSTPTKWRFLARNRLIAALGDATVVVEAGWRSGSLNTAHHAAALGRPLGAVPGPVTSAASAGAHRLLRETDAQCITNADDVRELLGLRRGVEPLSDGRARTDDVTRLRDALSVRAARDPVELARRSGLAQGDVHAMLGLLHLDGRVSRSEAGWRLVPCAD